METDTTKRGGPWVKGQSGNPNGRPKGSPNKTTKFIRELVRESIDWPALIQSLVMRANDGDAQAARLLFSYAWGTAPTTERLENQEIFDTSFPSLDNLTS